MRIETMTINQLAARMRELGLHISNTKVADGIEQGAFPFAVCIISEKARGFVIYTKLFEEWARGLVVE